VWLAFQFSAAASEWLAQYIEGSEQVLKIVAFALILTATSAGLALAGKLLEGMLKLIMLNWVNRLLGIAFSLLKAGLIAGLAIMVFCSLNSTFGFVGKEQIDGSILLPPLKDLAHKVFPYLKELLTFSK
jgi:membrane protein required for colicin V production